VAADNPVWYLNPSRQPALLFFTLVVTLAFFYFDSYPQLSMVNLSSDMPPSFSVNLVRRASVQSRARECGSQNSSHYNLKRLSQDLSQISSNGLLWYGKASESYEVHVNTVTNPGRLQRRLSQIITPSKFWRDDDSPLEEFKAFGGDTDGEEIENPTEASRETRPSSRASYRHTYNLPNKKFCVAKDQVEIDYVHNRYKQVMYPHLPMTRLPEGNRNSTYTSGLASLVATESQVSLSSIYSDNTEASLTLELTSEQAAPQLPAGHLPVTRDISIKTRENHSKPLPPPILRPRYF
jgi:hypothetical protein